MIKNLKGAEQAKGLLQKDREALSELIAVYKSKLRNNNKQMRYYQDRQRVKNLGLAVPSSFNSRVDTSVGWCAKSVDMLASRSRLDGFTAKDEQVKKTVDRIVADNDLILEYDMATPAELVHSCGFWTVSKGGSEEQDVVINYHDAVSSAGVWDFRHKRIKYGFVIEDVEENPNNGSFKATFLVMHTDTDVIEIELRNGTWYASYKPHAMGRPCMEPMCYKPSNGRPFGKSRVTPTLMGITDDMQREILRTSLHSELFSSSQKAILGVSDEQYDSIKANEFSVAMTKILAITRDENGEIPSLLQMPQSSMQPHLDMMDKLACRAASETFLPVSAFGVQGKGFTSTEELASASKDLIVEAESLNRTNGKALCNVMRMALAINGNKSLSELTDDERSITAHWIDPSMPTAAALADATVKLAGAVPEFGGTDVFWEMNGLDDDQRRRVKADMRLNSTRNAMNALFSGGVANEAS